jgi:branched-chain amino acid aminotransferase
VAECTSANLFAAFGDEVRTPPLSSGCLPGVTREVLLGEIHAPGITLVEKTLRPADLREADDVFITSTTRDLLPVVRIEDHVVPARGNVRERLQEEFSRYVAAYIGGQKKKRFQVT